MTDQGCTLTTYVHKMYSSMGNSSQQLEVSTWLHSATPEIDYNFHTTHS